MGDWLRKNNNRIDYGGRKYQFKSGQPLVIDGNTHIIEGLKSCKDISKDVLSVRFSENVYKRDNTNNIIRQYAIYKKGNTYRLEDVLIEMGMYRIFSISHNREHLIDELLK